MGIIRYLVRLIPRTGPNLARFGVTKLWGGITCAIRLAEHILAAWPDLARLGETKLWEVSFFALLVMPSAKSRSRGLISRDLAWNKAEESGQLC